LGGKSFGEFSICTVFLFSDNELLPPLMYLALRDGMIYVH